MYKPEARESREAHGRAGGGEGALSNINTSL